MRVACPLRFSRHLRHLSTTSGLLPMTACAHRLATQALHIRLRAKLTPMVASSISHCDGRGFRRGHSPLARPRCSTERRLAYDH